MAGDDLGPRDWKEARRQRAMELAEQGWEQWRIAEALGISEGAVSQWLSRRRDGEAEAWRNKERPGRPPKLPQAQLEMLPDLLSHGAEAFGFRGEIWTAARVATVVSRYFGVQYHKRHISRLLEQLRWSPQTPIVRALQRDEAAIAHFREQRWPALKKTQRSRLDR
jgi:transposase